MRRPRWVFGSAEFASCGAIHRGTGVASPIMFNGGRERDSDGDGDEDGGESYGEC